MTRCDRDGKFVLSHMDEFIDELLIEDRSCDVILPRIQKRNVLEGENKLQLFSTSITSLELFGNFQQLILT